MTHNTNTDPYRGALLGLVAGLGGTLAMGQYWTRVAPLTAGDDSGSGDSQPKPDQNVISPLGQQHEPGESSTAALGRKAYEAVEHHEPGKQTRAALSEGVHWGTGALSGALFGVLASRRRERTFSASLLGGAAFGAALWAANDEGLVPLLGLQDGPKSGNLKGHANRLGAHVFFGAGTGLLFWALDRAGR